MKPNIQAAPSTAGATSVVAWLPLVALPVTAILTRNRLPAWLFMWALAFAIFFGLKWATWWRARDHLTHRSRRSLAYLFAWPGMDAEAFLDSNRVVSAPRKQEWVAAAIKTFFGILLLWFLARRIPPQDFLLRGWIGLLGMVCLLHFGAFYLLALFWQWRGIDAQPIMAKPLLSQSLSEFWGRRWNLGFRQLAHELIFRPLHKRIGVTSAGLLVFLVSGLIHDLVISLPAHAGYGLPTLYFLVQGLGVTLERSSFGRKLGLQHGITARIFLFLITATPAFWLFHPPFVTRVIIPFMHAIHSL